MNSIVPDSSLTARSIAENVQSGEWSALEVLEGYLSQITQHESEIHAFTTVLEEEARATARETDKDIAAGKILGPLAGVPVALKDNLCTNGIRTTAGSRILENWKPPYDATVVQKLSAAGATVIATAGSDEKCKHVLSLGADYVFNYRNNDLVSCVLDITNNVGVDRMVDVAFGVNVAAAPQLIRANGYLASYSSDRLPKPEVPFLEFMYKNITIQPFSIYGMSENAKINAFQQIGELLATRRLSHLIGRTYAFTDMISAHQAIEKDDLFGVCVVEVAQDC